MSIPRPDQDISRLVEEFSTRFGTPSGTEGRRYTLGTYTFEYRDAQNHAIVGKAKRAGQIQDVDCFRKTAGEVTAFRSDHRWLAFLYHHANIQGLNPAKEISEAGNHFAIAYITGRLPAQERDD